MQKEQRKSRRQPIRYSAWVSLTPDTLHGCVLSDISETGARLEVEDAAVLPDRFTLWLARNGAARGECEIVWRKKTQVGVKFERRTAAADKNVSAGDAPHAAGRKDIGFV